MTRREQEYLMSITLSAYSTLLRRCGVRNPTFYIVPPKDLMENWPWW